MSSHRLDVDAWSKMSMFSQMGNIGSEVGRALSAKRQGQDSRMQAAFYRGLDLIDATAKLWAGQHDNRLKELLRAREEFVKSIIEKEEDTTLESYFMNFAVAAQLRKS